MFMDTVFFEEEGKMLQSKRNPDMYLLYFELLIHPTNFILKNGIKHPAKAMLTFKGQTSSLDKISHLDELVKILKFSPFFPQFSVFLDFLRKKYINDSPSHYLV